jgi:energy-coupling factor transporter ATP-binding protein EcfA2
MFVMFFGPSGSGKSTAINQADMLLDEAVPEVPRLPSEFTSESLTGYLSKEYRDTGMAKGFFVSHEVSKILGGKDYVKGNAEKLSDLYDGRYLDKDTRTHGRESMENIYIGFLVGSNPRWMYDVPVDIFLGGLGRRLIFISELTPKHYVSEVKHDMVSFHAVANVMRERMGPSSFGESDMPLTDGSRKLMSEWYMKKVVPLKSTPDEIRRNYATSMQEQALKMGACLSVLEGGPTTRLEAAYLNVGMRLVESYIGPMFREYEGLVPSEHSKLKNSISRAAVITGGRIKEIELFKVVGKNMGSKTRDIIQALSQLIEEGELRRVYDEGAGQSFVEVVE